MHHDVAYGYAGKLVAFVLRPMLSTIQRNPEAKLRAEIKKILRNGILFDDVRIAANAAIGCYQGRPGLAVISSFVDMRVHVPERVPVEGGISCGRIIEPRFNPGNP